MEVSEKWIRVLGAAALVVYSVILIGVEVGVSQEYADLFFTDIRGPVYLYALNTTVSVAFLWSAALVFAVCVLCVPSGRRHRRERLFYLSQIPIFAFLAFDDRFLFHENFGSRFGIPDVLIIGGVGVVELVLLLTLGGVLSQTTERKLYIFAAGASLTIMLFVDTFIPSEAVPRLSVEDISKTWGGAFLFLFAWSICRDKILDLKRKAGQTSR